ncbi:MAG TPA: radical SAM protein [Anaerolineae bacterium]|nr:radical SAM protein [Anaerolineae bacterium]
MRICLVSNLNLTTWYNSDREPTMLHLPLGLLSLAAVLEEAGHHVSVLDFNYAVSQGAVSLDDGFYNAVADRVQEQSPQLVGFSTMCNSYHIALRMAETAKARLPQVPILFGGPQASAVDTETLEAFPFVDMVLRGEAEQTLPLLLASLELNQPPSQVPGLTYRIDGHTVRNPDPPLLKDLDSLPMPAYHLFPYDIRSDLDLDVGRGCPFACSFCSTSLFWRRRYRLKSVERTIEEIQVLRQQYDAESFSFNHDLFTANRERVQEFCERLQAEEMDITWSCAARIDTVDPELLLLMAAAGCRNIFYGVETGSPRMQREIQKNLSIDQVWSAVDATVNAEINATLSFIAGFPTERTSDLEQTMGLIQALLKKPRIRIQLHLLAPLAGTLDFQRFESRLRYDGYHSDAASFFSGLQFLETEWFLDYPKIFCSFHHFETDEVPRSLLCGLDVFVNVLCSTMRETIRRLLPPQRTLWRLYRGWREWTDTRDRGAGPVAMQDMDQFILDFHDFVAEQVTAGEADFDMGVARDEILAFYLRRYGRLAVLPEVPSESGKTPSAV